MIIPQPLRSTQHYQRLIDYQSAAHAFDRPTTRQLVALASHITASERQARYLTVLARRGGQAGDSWAPYAQVNQPMFDPIKAIVYLKQRDLGEALWLAFLLIHTGDGARSDWHYLRQLYGNHGQLPLTWARVSQVPDRIAQWVTQAATATGFKFGKHRKYESLKQLSQVVQSYGDWLQDMGGIPSLTQPTGDPMARFAELYTSMSVYRFGRLAKFEFLSLLGYLGVLAVKADHCYLTQATGPKRGAKLLFGTRRRDNALEALAIQTAAALQVDYAVFEAALCHWQAAPNEANSQYLLP